MHIMFDLETLDTTPASAVLSIGAVLFNGRGVLPHPSLHVAPDLAEQFIQRGRTVSPSTVAWWQHNSPEAKQAVIDLTAMPLSVVRCLLIDLLKAASEADDAGLEGVWANGVAFDIPILESLFGQDLFSHTLVRDYRTLRKLLPNVLMPEREAVKHSAFDDAAMQAAHTVLLLDHLWCMETHYATFQTE